MNVDQTITRQRDLIALPRPFVQILASVGYVGFAGFPNDYADLPVSRQNVMAIYTLRRPVPELDGIAFLESLVRFHFSFFSIIMFPL